MNNQNQSVKDKFLVKTSKQVAATTKKLQEIKQLLPDQMNLEDVGESIRKGTFKMSTKTERQQDTRIGEKTGDNSKDNKKVDDGDVTDGCAMGVASGYLNRIKGQKEFLSSEKSQKNKLESKGVASSFLDKIKDQNPNQDEKKSCLGIAVLYHSSMGASSKHGLGFWEYSLPNNPRQFTPISREIGWPLEQLPEVFTTIYFTH